MTNKIIGGTGRFLSPAECKQLDEACIKFKGFLFTPRLKNGKRIGIVLSAADRDRASGRGNLDKRGVVIDLNTGRQFEIEGADCGIPTCICDALATPVRKARKE